MKVVDLRIGVPIVEAVREVKAMSYDEKERIVAEFNDFIIDSNKSEEENLKEYYSQWNKFIENGIDWEQRRYEIAKELLPQTYNVYSNSVDKDPFDKPVERAISLADTLIEELKKNFKDKNE